MNTANGRQPDPAWYRGPDDPSGYRVLVASDLRRRRGPTGVRLTQAGMAKALGRELGRNIPESSVARWESGRKLAGADVYLAYEAIAKSASQGTRDSMDERMTRVERALSLLPLDLARDDLLTVAQAAKLAKVSRQTIHNWVKAARVRYVTQGRRLLVSRADVLAAVVAD